MNWTLIRFRLLNRPWLIFVHAVVITSCVFMIGPMCLLAPLGAVPGYTAPCAQKQPGALETFLAACARSERGLRLRNFVLCSEAVAAWDQSQPFLFEKYLITARDSPPSCSCHVAHFPGNALVAMVPLAIFTGSLESFSSGQIAASAIITAVSSYYFPQKIVRLERNETGLGLF